MPATNALADTAVRLKIQDKRLAGKCSVGQIGGRIQFSEVAKTLLGKPAVPPGRYSSFKGRTERATVFRPKRTKHSVLEIGEELFGFSIRMKALRQERGSCKMVTR